MRFFIPLLPETVAQLVKKRPDEIKLGERLQVAGKDWEKALQDSNARYVLLGIPEDIGVRANGGIGGTRTAWKEFLRVFFNIQSTPGFPGSEILVLGHFDFSPLDQGIPNTDTVALRKLVEEIDQHVTALITQVQASGKLPIVIGGGHNNAYPLIAGSVKGLGCKSLNVVSLDAHTDFRPKEGRHSGNAFRYAYDEGLLRKYAVIGIHEIYTPASILVEFAANPNLHSSFFEDIVLTGRRDMPAAISDGIEFTDDGLVGVELDLDAIENVLASAATPSGIQVTDARRYVTQVGLRSKSAYLHLSEGAAELDNGLNYPSIGKLLSYLVTDFVKAHRQKESMNEAAGR